MYVYRHKCTETMNLIHLEIMRSLLFLWFSMSKMSDKYSIN